MSGYLTAWRDKPDTPAGRILKTISAAGDWSHHTEAWADPYSEDETSQMDNIEKCVESEISALESSHAEVREAAQELLSWPSMSYAGGQSRDVAKAIAKLQEAIKSATEAKP